MYDTAQFVFSFRSPYAWIAARWVLPQLSPELELQWRPFFPLPSFSNFPPPLDAKTQYLVRDVVRLVRHYGGDVSFPSAHDPNWALPHCAFLEADARGKGREFALAVWDARFGKGQDVGEPEVVARAAESVGLDVQAILDAALDEAHQRELVSRVQRDYDEAGIFGVPTLILPRGSRYWGHDRIEWAIREGRLPAAAA